MSLAVLFPPLDVAKVEAYLRAKMPARPDLRIIEVARSYPGMSRETWWLRAGWSEAGQNASERFVVRLDPPGGSLSGRPLELESEIYRRLWDTPVPVPRLLFHEKDPEWLLGGREFSVRAWVDGSLEPDGLHTDGPEGDATRVEIVREHMRRLATIHAVDWRALGFDKWMSVPESPETVALEGIEHQTRMLEANRVEVYPAFGEVRRWMLANPPPPPSRITLRKENNGIGEEVWRGRTIVAMCDWETSSLGDPALDLAVAMNTTAKYWDQQAALDYYNEVSGDQVTMGAVRWYQNYWHLSGWAGLANCLRNFKTGGDRRVQMITLGALLVNVRQDILARAAGI